MKKGKTDYDRHMFEKPIYRLPERLADSHKGNYGKVLVIAGSKGMLGSACLTSMAALRAGAGLVTLAVPNSLQIAASIKLTSVMTYGLSETNQGTISMEAVSDLIDIQDRFDLFVIGPGLGNHPEAYEAVRQFVQKIDKPIILDADGLNAFEGYGKLLQELKDKPLTFTPHLKEFSRLTGLTIADIKRDTKKAIHSFLKGSHHTLILKGHPSYVVHKDEFHELAVGNPGMATAGAGDVLTGLVAGLMGCVKNPVQAAYIAVQIHGIAGDLAAREFGEISLISEDILKFIPHAFSKYKNTDKK